VHHSVHFYHFDNPYFRYIKRHHLYHHSPKGGDVGYGLTNGFWDIIFSTRISAEQRRLLYGQGKVESHVLDQRQAGAGPLSTA
jgi:sterol desaturase/sphingolipid hydroxylase (fatty acid hydroxylase superfamily)